MYYFKNRFNHVLCYVMITTFAILSFFTDGSTSKAFILITAVCLGIITLSAALGFIGRIIDVREK